VYSAFHCRRCASSASSRTYQILMDCWALQVRNPFSYTGNRVVKQVGATMAYLCVVASYITSSIPMSKKHMVMSLMRVKNHQINRYSQRDRALWWLLHLLGGKMAENSAWLGSLGWSQSTFPTHSLAGYPRLLEKNKLVSTTPRTR
jgi:hypothetical protein